MVFFVVDVLFFSGVINCVGFVDLVLNGFGGDCGERINKLI